MNYIGADIILKALKANGVKLIYGYPGGSNIPFYDKLNNDNGIKHILVRQEQAATFAAQGQSRTSDIPGVCMVTSGPGAANALTGVYDAYMDNIPLIFITGQVPFELMGGDVFQEMDTIGATMSYTKHSFILKKANEIPEIINKAFEIATTGRPGPVHIDFPKNVQNEVYTGKKEIIGFKKKNSKSTFRIKDEKINSTIKLLEKAKKPVLLIGHGIKISGAEEELNTFVNKLGIPTVSTLHAKGVLREDNKNYLGMLGMHGFYHANLATYNADLIINIGSRFDDRIVGTYETFAKNAKVIHIDIDKSELNKLIKTDIPILSDAKVFLEKINNTKLKKLKINSWKQEINNWEIKKPFIKETKNFGVKNSLNIINSLTKFDLDKYIFVTDVGQHQMWTAQVIKVASTRSWLSSGGAGTMGFALPSSIGASLNNTSKTIIAIAGDGGSQMNIQELQLLKDHNLNIKFIIVNNNFLGMVRQWQDLFFKKNYAATPITAPNFKLVAKAYGINGYSTDTQKGFEKILKKELDIKGPALIEVKLKKNEDNIFPMVAPGTPLGETMVC